MPRYPIMKLKLKWLMAILILAVISVIVWSSSGWTMTNRDINNHSLQVPQPQNSDALANNLTYNEGDESDIFLIPATGVLLDKSEEDLLRLYWRYVNTLQVLCRNQMRHGALMDGGKEVCIDKEFVPKRPCLVYSFGSDLRFDFEKAVVRLYGCEIHTFDPSTKIDESNKKRIPPFVSYHEIGIDGRNHENRRGWRMRTLPTIIKELGHENVMMRQFLQELSHLGIHYLQRVIDILKIDAEGGEWSGFQDLSHFKPLENVKQLLVELHFGRIDEHTHWGDVQTPYQLDVLRTLYNIGFRIFMREHTMSFIRQMDTVYGQQLCAINEVSLINLKWKK